MKKINQGLQNNTPDAGWYLHHEHKVSIGCVLFLPLWLLSLVNPYPTKRQFFRKITGHRFGECLHFSNTQSFKYENYKNNII